MGEYSDKFYDILCHPEEHTDVMVEKAHFHYRDRKYRRYDRGFQTQLDYWSLSRMQEEHISKINLRRDVKLSDTVYRDTDYQWFENLVELANSNEPETTCAFYHTNIILKELMTLLTTEDEFIILPARATWLCRMIRDGKRVVDVWNEVIKNKNIYEWFNKKDRKKLGFANKIDYIIPFTNDEDFQINDKLSLKTLLRILIINVLHWNLSTGEFNDDEHKAQWESANILYLGNPSRCLIDIYNDILYAMDGYFFLHFYGLDVDTIDRYRTGVDEVVIPKIKENIKKIIRYMASLHEDDVPNEINVQLIAYGAAKIQTIFHDEFLQGYGQYAMHTISFDLLENTKRINPITIIYMINQEYRVVPNIIKNLSKYFLTPELMTFRSRCNSPRSFNRTVDTIIADRNRRNKDKTHQYVMLDMWDNDLVYVNGFQEFVMSAHMGTIEVDEPEPIMPEMPNNVIGKISIPKRPWKGVSRTSGEWNSVLRDKRDIGSIDDMTPDIDTIAVDDKYAEKEMSETDLMYSTAIVKY